MRNLIKNLKEFFKNWVINLKWESRKIKELLFPEPRERWKKKKTSGISIMNLNLRSDKIEDKDNGWIYRRDSIVKMIKDKCPDIICCQESWSHMVQFLKSKIGCNYDCYGISTFTGKRLDKTLSMTMGNIIFYDKNKFDLDESDVFWLSETPHKLSKSWESEELRNCIVIKLMHKKTGKYYTIFNTHFDHVSTQARNNSAELVMSMSKKMGFGNTFIVGDLNAKISNKELKPFKDLSYYPRGGSVKTTFNGFRTNKKTICDYIISLNNEETDYMFEQITDGYGVPYLTDHYPMMVVI